MLDEIERQNAEFAYQPGHVMATLLRLARAGLRVPALEEDVERLRGLLAWCRPRLRNDAYRETLDRMLRDGTEADHTPIVQSNS